MPEASREPTSDAVSPHSTSALGVLNCQMRNPAASYRQRAIAPLPSPKAFHSTLSHFPEVRLATLTTTRSVSAGSLLAGISVLSQASHQLPLLQLLGKIPIHTLSGFSKALQKFTQRFRKGNCLRLGRR
jgi:hypothetical protein